MDDSSYRRVYLIMSGSFKKISRLFMPWSKTAIMVSQCGTYKMYVCAYIHEFRHHHAMEISLRTSTIRSRSWSNIDEEHIDPYECNCASVRVSEGGVFCMFVSCLRCWRPRALHAVHAGFEICDKNWLLFSPLRSFYPCRQASVSETSCWSDCLWGPCGSLECGRLGACLTCAAWCH